MGPAGSQGRGHEFHYSEIIVGDPRAGQSLPHGGPPGRGAVSEGYCRYRTLASYVHLHFGSNPDLAGNFVAYCHTYKGTKMMQPLLPQEIELESFRRIEAAVGDHGLPAPQWAVVRRMIHASAEVELLTLVRFHPQAIAAGVAALRQRRPVFTDTRMLLAGVSSRLAPSGHSGECLLDEPGMAALAKEQGLTRSAAAVEQAEGEVAGQHRGHRQRAHGFTAFAGASGPGHGAAGADYRYAGGVCGRGGIQRSASCP